MGREREWDWRDVGGGGGKRGEREEGRLLGLENWGRWKWEIGEEGGMRLREGRRA